VLRNLLLILAGVVMVTGFLSANLWRELRTERRLNADLLAQLAEARSEARPSAPPTLPAPEPVSPPDATAGRGEVVPEAAPDMRIVAAPPRGAIPPGSQPPSQQTLLTDPEYREALLAQTRLSVRSSYPGLVEELGLSERDAHELLTLLAESQLRLTTGLVDGLVSTDPAVRAETERLRRENQSRLNDSIAALLGDDKYTQFQHYQRTGGSRATVTLHGYTLALADQPLTAAQRRALVSAMASEQQRQQTEAQAMARNRSATTNRQEQALLLEETHMRQKEDNLRTLGVMAPHLTPEQLDVLRAKFESQVAGNEAYARVRRERDRVAQGQQ
jgi:hypothetical protein